MLSLRSSGKVFVGVCAASAALVLAGCGAGTAVTSSSGTLSIRGNVYGGQQPVSFSAISLYAAGTGGNGSAARSMLTLPVSSDVNGNFSLTGDYACANTEDQVYLVASGGNPGLALGTNNAALVMVDALGRCGDLPTTPFVTLNELTTVAAVYALTPFIADSAHVGATATNAAGLKNGFLNARLLASPYDGRNPVLAANLTVESAKLNTLANALASCINSDGTAGCTPLFTAATPSGGTVPTNTLQAALNIVRNPSNNVAAVFNAASSVPPFGGGLSSAPNDWTMSLKVTGGGMNSPEVVSLDAEGNVWVASYNGVLSAFSPQGTPLSATGYGVGVLSESFAVAVDTYDDLWVSVEEAPSHSGTRGSAVRFYGVQSAAAGQTLGGYTNNMGNSAVIYDATVQFPESLAADTNGNMMYANEGNSRAEIFDHNGNTVIDNLGAGFSGAPVAIAVDANHGLWLANQGSTYVTHVAADGTIAAYTNCCGGTDGVAVDSGGNAWFSDYYGNAVVEVSATGTKLVSKNAVGGISGPARIFVDGGQDVWVAEYRSRSFTHLAGNGANAATIAPGTSYSPAGGNGLDAGMLLPFGIAADATGNLWVSSSGTGSGITPSIAMFFGLATPTKTPLNPVPTAP